MMNEELKGCPDHARCRWHPRLQRCPQTPRSPRSQARRLPRLGLAVLCGLVFLSACAPVAEVNRFAPGEYPQRLSGWGILQRQGDGLTLGRHVTPYDVNTPLFADYALKLRTVWFPPGKSAAYAPDDAYAMPVGTVISKTFFYPMVDGIAQSQEGWNGDVASLDLGQVKLLETRLLVHQADGWDALAYVWRGDDAWLNVTGAVIPTQIAQADGPRQAHYIVPSRNQCAACHAAGAKPDASLPLGVTTRQLNRGYGGGAGNQLASWIESGWLRDAPDAGQWPRNPDWNDRDAPLRHLARSYLDANCGHCHNAAGSADHTGLWLDIRNPSHRRLGVCKPPIAAGQGTGGLRHGIAPGAPEASMLVFRMATNDPAARMPEIGRSLAHERALAVVSSWIESMPGECSAPQYRGAFAAE